VDNETQVICKHRTGIGGVLLAFLTGASVATTVILMTHKAREAVSPSAEQLLKRCDRAAEALDSRIPQTATS
jgi:cell division protein FtsL